MRKFLKISNALGSSASLVQGAGGNTSVKIGGRLFVKASGYFLKDLRQDRGYVVCDYLPIAKYLLGLKKYRTSLETPFNFLVNKTLIKDQSFGRPSIEMGLHAVIASKYVLHTHSVMANVLNFAQGGQRTIKKIFGNSALVINYKNPGLELGFALAREIKKLKHLPGIIFLKNHGLITHHDNAQTAYNLTMDVQKKIIEYLKQQKVYKPFTISKNPADFNRHMFPDSVVYNQIDFKKLPLSKKQVFYEICSLVNYIQSTSSRLKLKPVFLTQAKVNFLLEMEQEKYRINMLVHD